MRKLMYAAVALAALAFAAPALAAPPNDAFADATVIPALPFSDTVDVSTASTEPGEQQYCYYAPQTVWYAFSAPSSGVVRVSSSGFSDAAVTAYRQTSAGLGGLSVLNCAGFGNPIVFRVEAGQLYYVQAGKIFSGAGTLTIDIRAVPPPPNDNLADATSIASLPFDASIESIAATTETGEPTSPSVFNTAIVASAWYTFAAGADQSISVWANSCCWTPVVAVYDGTDYGSLSLIGTRIGFANKLTFRTTTGHRYSIQLARGCCPGTSTPLSLHVEVAPPPTAQFWTYPSDPSSFETVQFYDASYDPAQAGFEPAGWNLGDGTTASGCCPTHRYASDGDYTVELTVRTVDGRTASLSRVLQVRTHDVAIQKLLVPQSASPGQTRTISVGLSDLRYPENVQVQLLKSGPSGWVPVGSLTQSVPVRSGGRTTEFKYSYTFTAADATLGKISFRAIATILGARDALPGDNDVTSLPTRVS